MSIKKKPKLQTSEAAEEKASAFIDAAAKPQEDSKPKLVNLRFAPNVLEKIDAGAKRHGLTRNAYVAFLVSKAIDQGEG